MGEPPIEGKFSDRFPLLKVSHDVLAVEIDSGDTDTRVLRIGSEGDGEFEWGFTLVEQPIWLSAHRPLDPEQGDVDTLALTFDSGELEVGDYTATLMIFGVPLVRDSPKEIPIMLTVFASQAP